MKIPKTKAKYIVGIDEAGRGPLAGPVAIGGVVVSAEFNKSFFKGIKDSKQLKEEERELWFQLATEARRKGTLDYAVSLISEKIIDKHGIAYAIRLGIKRVLKHLNVDPLETHIFLDGGIKAPPEFIHQLTVIKGDEKIPVIGLASILAKVVRDRRMVKLAHKYPGYGFHVNKGYGTEMHRNVVKMFGPTDIHRKTFLTKIGQNKG